ncbi:hypothetical protein MWU52_06880 [Jannaschia sp. S6380]|nr:hypothetical protein [Jannaschia sp. S6380]
MLETRKRQPTLTVMLALTRELDASLVEVSREIEGSLEYTRTAQSGRWFSFLLLRSSIPAQLPLTLRNRS